MKIGLFGLGKMGRMVESVAMQQGHSVVPCEVAEVCIDFSHSSAVMDHVRWCAAHKKPIVIGTTAWETDLPTARELVENSGIAAIASPNFSLSMACFISLLQKARALFHEYELAGVEYHHSQKLDAPSGTAKYIAHTLEMKTPFTSVRCGRIPGKHVVIFDSPFDTIMLSHEAHHREGFALGAVKAAGWIKDKKGWHTLDEMVRDLYSSHYAL
jgi:4-hydroxy-tetrahydrodipicolinate reductase